MSVGMQFIDGGHPGERVNDQHTTQFSIETTALHDFFRVVRWEAHRRKRR